jgi:hypothetical protein
MWTHVGLAASRRRWLSAAFFNDSVVGVAPVFWPCSVLHPLNVKSSVGRLSPAAVLPALKIFHKNRVDTRRRGRHIPFSNQLNQTEEGPYDSSSLYGRNDLLSPSQVALSRGSPTSVATDALPREHQRPRHGLNAPGRAAGAWSSVST